MISKLSVYYVNQIFLVHVTSFCWSCNMRSTKFAIKLLKSILFLTSNKRTFFVFVPDDTINYGITCDQCWLLSSWTFIVSFSFYKAAHSTTGPRARRLLSSKETIKQIYNWVDPVQPTKQFKVHQPENTKIFRGHHQTALVLQIKYYILLRSC